MKKIKSTNVCWEKPDCERIPSETQFINIESVARHDAAKMTLPPKLQFLQSNVLAFNPFSFAVDVEGI